MDLSSFLEDFVVFLNIAQSLLDVTKSNMEKVKEDMAKCHDQRAEVEHKKMKMLDSYITKRKANRKK